MVSLHLKNYQNIFTELAEGSYLLMKVDGA